MEAQTEEHRSAVTTNPPVKARHQLSKPDTSGVNNSGVSQPLLTLSGLGLAYGSLKSVLRKIKRSTNISPFQLSKYVKRLPKYMGRNYVKYPLMFMMFLAATRRIRSTISQ